MKSKNSLSAILQSGSQSLATKNLPMIYTDFIDVDHSRTDYHRGGTTFYSVACTTIINIPKSDIAAITVTGDLETHNVLPESVIRELAKTAIGSLSHEDKTSKELIALGGGINLPVKALNSFTNNVVRQLGKYSSEYEYYELGFLPHKKIKSKDFLIRLNKLFGFDEIVSKQERYNQKDMEFQRYSNFTYLSKNSASEHYHSAGLSDHRIAGKDSIRKFVMKDVRIDGGYIEVNDKDMILGEIQKDGLITSPMNELIKEVIQATKVALTLQNAGTNVQNFVLSNMVSSAEKVFSQSQQQSNSRG